MGQFMIYYRQMRKTERFVGNGKTVATPLFELGDIEDETEYQNVRDALALLPSEKLMILALVVACDKAVGEAENRWIKERSLIDLVRELAKRVGLPMDVDRFEDAMSVFEARGYYLRLEEDEFELAAEAKADPLDVYCTLRTYLDAVVRWGGDLAYVLQPGAEWVFPGG